jgi:uncharacterized protein (UPF0264 family)
MRLLVSVIRSEEVDPAIEGGANIIDIKNPSEGSLGAPFPWTAKNIIITVDSRRETSCAIGDLPNLPGTISLAAAGAAGLSPNYIKLGLFGVSELEDASVILKTAVRAVKSVDDSIGVIACGYGDYKLTGSISPLELPEIASTSQADGVLIDTINKDGRSLFDFIKRDQLRSFITEARDNKLIGALAGSLKIKHAQDLRFCDPDVVGIRGAACIGNDRKEGNMDPKRISAFKASLI